MGKLVRHVREALRSLTPLEAVEILMLILWPIFLGTRGKPHPLPAIRSNSIGPANVCGGARLGGIARVVSLFSVGVFPTRSSRAGPDLSEFPPPAPAPVFGACKFFNEHIASY